MSSRWTSWIVLGGLFFATPCFAQGFGDMAVVRAIDALKAKKPKVALRNLRPYLATRRDTVMHHEARYVAAQAALFIEPITPQLASEALGYLDSLDEKLSDIGDFVLTMMVKAYRALGQWDGIEEVWIKLLRDYPDSPHVYQAYYGRADVRFARGDWRRAKRGYELALRKYPRADAASNARFNVFRCDEYMGRIASAAEGYAWIVYRQPADPMVENASARLDNLIEQGMAKEPNFHDHLSRVDRLLRSYLLPEAGKALDELETLETSQSEGRQVAYRRAQLSYKLRRYDEAINIFQALSDSSRGALRTKYQRWLAQAYSAADRTDEAVATYQDLAQRARYRAEGREALYKAAWLAYNGRQHQVAIRLFGEFIERYPKDRWLDAALWYMAWNAYRLGDLPMAIQTLERIRTQLPRSSLVQRTWYWQGRFMMHMGRVSEARYAYIQAVEKKPLDYYAVLARMQLENLRKLPSPIAWRGNELKLASLDTAPIPPPEPNPEELPIDGGLKKVKSAILPWGASVFNWQTPDGKRALRLMRLGDGVSAAELLGRIPTLPGHTRTEISYARARISYALGDYYGAYRIVGTVFRDHMDETPNPENLRYFQLAYPRAHFDLVERAAGEFGVEPLLILSIMRQESAFKVRARSWASANGLMQIIPATGRRIAKALDVEYTNGLLRVPEVNIRFGSWYIGKLINKFFGHYVLALSSYNAGPRAVAKWVDVNGGLHTDEFVEEIPYRETRSYVKRILGNLAVYTHLYSDKALTLPDATPTRYLNTVNF